MLPVSIINLKCVWCVSSVLTKRNCSILKSVNVLDAHGLPRMTADSLTFSLDTNVTHIQSTVSVFHWHTRGLAHPHAAFFPTQVLKKSTFYSFKRKSLSQTLRLLLDSELPVISNIQHWSVSNTIVSWVHHLDTSFYHKLHYLKANRALLGEKRNNTVIIPGHGDSYFVFHLDLQNMPTRTRITVICHWKLLLLTATKCRSTYTSLPSSAFSESTLWKVVNFLVPISA